MLFVSAFLLEILICLHVIGGAMLFHRVFPRESPWWGFFLPTLAFITLLNCIEHFVALPNLLWLLPITAFGSLWLLVRPGCSRKRLVLPSVLFVVTFTYVFAIKCMQPDVNFYCTEGLTDLTRILDFSLGEKIPPQDCWLPPVPHTGYYTFMHYGASVLKRLLDVDIGTAYNVGSVFLNTLVLLAGAAVGYSLSNSRRWVAILTLVVMASGFTGSTPLKALLNPSFPNPAMSIDISVDWTNPQRNEFAPLLAYLPPGDAFRVYTPGVYVYYSEFHATIAGHFLALLSVFGAAEILRRRRTLVPWIWLLVAPAYAILSCTWFFFLITLLSGPTLVLAWVTGRRPSHLPAMVGGTLAILFLLAPTAYNFAHGAAGQKILFFWQWQHDAGMFLIQLWPLYLPWLVLLWARKRLNLAGRWLHFWLVPLFIFAEVIFFTDRQTTLEKTMGGSYGMAFAILCPLLFVQRGWLYRGLSAIIVLSAAVSLWGWTSGIYTVMCRTDFFMCLSGDHFIQQEPQLHRMKIVLGRLHGQTVLIGKNTEAWFESPCLPAFTNNRCYVGWTNAEEACGNGPEALARAALNNTFYDGTMTDPLLFLQSNHIAAVLVWPDDKMSDEWLAKMRTQLGPEFIYNDCKGDDPNNAGVFLRRSTP